MEPITQTPPSPDKCPNCGYRLRENNDIFEYRGTKIDIRNQNIQIDEKIVWLTKGEFSVIFTLFQVAGRMVTREEIAANLYPEGWEKLELGRVIDVHISNARKKLRECQSLIEIVGIRARGYILQ